MDAEDLDRQAGTWGGMSPQLVDMLLERGHLDVVVQAALERGKWFCARAAVRELCRLAQYERARAVIEPFARTGWGPARAEAADVFLAMGQVGPALDLVRPDEAEPVGARWREYARILASAGRVDEAVDVLAPRLDSGLLRQALVDVTAGAGCDERVLALLTPLVEVARRARKSGARSHPADRAVESLAQALERSGRAEEAIAVLSADVAAGHFYVLNTVEFHARLLARHDRVDALRELAVGGHGRSALEPYVMALERLGRAEEAGAFLEAGGHRAALMFHLGRQGRLDDAVEVARPAFEYLGDGNLLESAVHLLVDAGRPDEALRLMDERSPAFAEEYDWWLLTNRVWVLAVAGLYDEALAHAAALPPEVESEPQTTIGWVLGEAGRVQEAVDLLGASTEPGAARVLAEILIRHGRPVEAVAALS
ncbi:hypothetical protein EF912_01185 [Streptomyces sp. WAC07061]|uniref:hypothetical protein n=1 Tax=Streptomyces sp. WAC07061 TaxID=2487410 RepID=UPI000F775F63|nr:hypothetical protein [Streptomyces sp. WAC07061]RSS64881.1 hypothetical protein EF912_01185 [Streptomyces sp. WAC07061]